MNETLNFGESFLIGYSIFPLLALMINLLNGFRDEFGHVRISVLCLVVVFAGMWAFSTLPQSFQKSTLGLVITGVLISVPLWVGVFFSFKEMYVDPTELRKPAELTSIFFGICIVMGLLFAGLLAGLLAGIEAFRARSTM